MKPGWSAVKVAREVKTGRKALKFRRRMGWTSYLTSTTHPRPVSPHPKWCSVVVKYIKIELIPHYVVWVAIVTPLPPISWPEPVATHKQKILASNTLISLADNPQFYRRMCCIYVFMYVCTWSEWLLSHPLGDYAVLAWNGEDVKAGVGV